MIKFLPITQFAHDLREALTRHLRGIGSCIHFYLVFDMLVVSAQHEPASARQRLRKKIAIIHTSFITINSSAYRFLTAYPS